MVQRQRTPRGVPVDIISIDTGKLIKMFMLPSEDKDGIQHMCVLKEKLLYQGCHDKFGDHGA